MAAAAEAKAEKPAKKKLALRLPGRRVLVLGAIAIVVLGAGGGAGWFFFLRGRGHGHGPDGHGPAPVEAHVWTAGTVVVNIAGTGGRRYLRTTIELGVNPKAAKQLEEHRAQVIDAALGILVGEPLDRLLDPGQREPLRVQLKERLNGALGRPNVTHVFLTEFVVQ
jgi:flagellar protein FliL